MAASSTLTPGGGQSVAPEAAADGWQMMKLSLNQTQT